MEFLVTQIKLISDDGPILVFYCGPCGPCSPCGQGLFQVFLLKVEKILKGSLDSIPSPSTSVKIQIMGGKVCLRCKGKTLLGLVKNF
jgi:hypothetical protein